MVSSSSKNRRVHLEGEHVKCGSIAPFWLTIRYLEGIQDFFFQEAGSMNGCTNKENEAAGQKDVLLETMEDLKGLDQEAYRLVVSMILKLNSERA